MVYVHRRENETTPALLRRFTRRVQQAGILIQARKLKAYTSQENRRVLRERALRRVKRRKDRERLEKLGKIPE